MLNDDAKVESLELERTTGEQGGQQQSGGDSVVSWCIISVNIPRYPRTCVLEKRARVGKTSGIRVGVGKRARVPEGKYK
jgi:hypothetical protein